jgi:hypothetical protein
MRQARSWCAVDAADPARMIQPMPWTVETSLLQQAARNGFVVAGALLFAVGMGDVLAGRAKLREYRALVAQAPAAEPHDPAALFPKASEAQERHAVAQAKLTFYELLVLVGQLLAAGGVLLMGIGVFRHRLRALRTAPASAGFH